MPAPVALLLASKRAYALGDFERAAAQLQIELAVGTDRCHQLAELWPEGAWPLDYRDPTRAVKQIVEHASAKPLAGILALDEDAAVIAAGAAEVLGLGYGTVAATCAAADKQRLRQALTAAGCAQPRFAVVPRQSRRLPEALRFPVVIKPLHLSASRGVMRADDSSELAARMQRLCQLLENPELEAKNPAAAALILIEEYLHGDEVAVEALVDHERLVPIAVFDKPDPLEGPVFAETIYVTPSQRSAPEQAAIIAAVAAAARAIGVVNGPIHAELRLHRGQPVVLELAARPIGGLCGRTLELAGVSLPEVLLAHAIGRDVGELLAGRRSGASGVYMLPVPKAGVLRGIDGIDAAAVMPLIRDVVLTARLGEHVVPLPEGNTYMGFVFADGADSAAVTHALRRAAAALEFFIAPLL